MSAHACSRLASFTTPCGTSSMRFFTRECQHERALATTEPFVLRHGRCSLRPSREPSPHAGDPSSPDETPPASNSNRPRGSQQLSAPAIPRPVTRRHHSLVAPRRRFGTFLPIHLPIPAGLANASATTRRTALSDIRQLSTAFSEGTTRTRSARPPPRTRITPSMLTSPPRPHAQDRCTQSAILLRNALGAILRARLTSR